MMPAVKRAVFLDRDDTLIACNELPPAPPPAARGDLVDPSLVRLLPGVADGCARMIARGYTLIVVTNQGGAARGALSLSQVEAVNDALRIALNIPDLLVYFCPLHPKGNITHLTREHPWRKPSAGMILAAATECNITLPESWLIGDAHRDLDAGIAAGIPADHTIRVDEVVTFAHAVDRVLEGDRPR